MTTATVLVVGATGILRPAAMQLARTRRVIASARSTSALHQLAAEVPGLSVLAADRDLDLVARLRTVAPTPRDAIVYAPAASAPIVPDLARELPGRIVHVITSAALSAPPGAEWHWRQLPPAPDRVVRLITGWPERGGWHTAPEISTAAVLCLDDGADRVLGLTRPP